HNFRPDYLKLAALTQRLDVQRVLALTATATPEVLRDIRDAFAIDEDDAIRTPFYRPNLHLRSTVVSPLDHYPTLLSRLRDRAAGATLIYVTLQKTAEEIAERLRGDGIDAFHYHAGMKPEERAQVQQDFIKSTESVIVATIAFGMGIDKSNLRYVYHYNPPKSLESYAQEIGRAGRDGRTAICEVLLCPNDRTVLENFVFGDTPTLTGITSLLQHLLHQPDSFFISQYAVANDCDIRQLVLRTLLTYLELDGYIAGTSPRYDTYEILPHTSSKTILAHFDKDPDRREFISGILCSLSKGRKWFRLNMPIVVRRLGDRERIVSALNYMEQKGWIEMKVKGLMHGYRWLKRIDDPNGLACDLYNRLEQRESGEIARMD
ncbi:MAG: helicase-related protein, partial [Planctomycetota bacterium]